RVASSNPPGAENFCKRLKAYSEIQNLCIEPMKPMHKFWRVVKCVTRLSVGTTDRLRVEIMRPGETENAASSQLVCLGVAVICAVALMAPTQGDPAAANSLLPQHFHLTVPQKLVAAYILGIVSILLLRPMT
ncbi:hypothetical protein TELCIR_08511, partial [Teladorsagia circumcincta]